MCTRISFSPPTILLLASCAVDAPRAAPIHKPFFHDALGIGFDLPLDWTHRSPTSSRGSALVFSGPMHTNQYYTTVTLQAVPTTRQSLYDALLTIHEPILGLPDFAWLAREPMVIDDRPALSYLFRVQLYESLRLKSGVLFEASGYLVNLTYSGTPALFGDGLGVFEEIIASLTVTDIVATHSDSRAYEHGSPAHLW
jgi:hypothetical protein